MRAKNTNRWALGMTMGAIACALTCQLGCNRPGVADQEPENAAEQNSADESSSSSSGSISGWASDTWNGAVSGGTQTVEDTGKWISEMYESAKDKGITSATSVKEWVSDDWNAQGDWQYKLLSLDSSDGKAIEKQLNDAGADRWECYHVDTSKPQWTFFMKRSRRSYLSRVPLKDLANMLPGASGESGE